MDWFLYDNGLRLERVKAGRGGVVKNKIINLNVKKSSINGSTIPLHKKEDPLKKENYRPVILITHNRISKNTWNTRLFNDHARKMEKCFR